MNVVSHSEIDKKIKTYLKKFEIDGVDVDVEEREKDLTKLGMMFGNYFAISGYLGDFKKIETEKRCFYYYDTVSIDKQKKTSYMAISEEDKPLFLMSYTSFGDQEIKYSEQSFSTYDKDTKHIVSRIKENLLLFGDTAIFDVSLLDTNDNEYYRKLYKYYYHIDNIVAYQIGDDKFINYGSISNNYKSNDTRLDLAINTVEMVSNKIRNSLDEALDINQDYVKEYKIKRKNR